MWCLSFDGPGAVWAAQQRKAYQTIEMSSLLSADDLNDFIRPGVACIKPVEDLRKVPEGGPRHVELEFESGDGGGRAEVEVEVGADGEMVEVEKGGSGSRRRLEKAQISLADCLACSGCITSSEEVLISQHSFQEFVSFWTEHAAAQAAGELHYVLSLSQQARASFANAFDVSVEVADRVLARVFVEHYGFEYVVSVGVGRRLAYAALYDEVEARTKSEPEPAAGAAAGANVLASICPGWVLYVEKTHPELAGRLSRVRSPQYITCRLVKDVLRRERGYERAQVYNLSVMPCFDKKLEASRDDDVVECVITPREVVSMLLEDDRVDLERLIEDEAAAAAAAGAADYAAFVRRVSPPGWFAGNMYGWGGDAGDESGGYAVAYLEQYRRRHGVTDGWVRTVRGRNEDVYELQLVRGGGAGPEEVVCRSGVINGFKNIQNLVRRLKDPARAREGARPRGGLLKSSRRRAAAAHKGSGGGGGPAAPAPAARAAVDLSNCPFVEVMACPSGCINGGGQLTGSPAVSPAAWLARARARYAEVPAWAADSDDEQRRLQRWLAQYGGGQDDVVLARAPSSAAGATGAKSDAEAAVAVASAGW